MQLNRRKPFEINQSNEDARICNRTCERYLPFSWQIVSFRILLETLDGIIHTVKVVQSELFPVTTQRWLSPGCSLNARA